MERLKPITVQRLIEQAQRLAESCIPLVLLQHGLKCPIKGADGSWIIVAEPDAVAPAIENVAHGHPINLGALLAPKGGSRLLVVDADGADAWPKLRDLGLSSSASFWVSRTGRGNHHVFGYWLGPEAPPQRVIRAGGLPVDLLTNGFAVVPPSDTHLEPNGGGLYRWVEGHSPTDIPLAELDPLPVALLDWWVSLAGTERGGCTTDTDPPGKDAAWKLIGGPIPENTRNNTLARIGGYLHPYLPPLVVEAVLLAINDARCQPPLEPKEVLSIAKSICRYPQPGVNGHPRAALPRYVREEQPDV